MTIQKNFLRTLSPEQLDIVIKEMAERSKNAVFMNAEVRMRETVEALKKCSELEIDERITINYNFNFVFNDLIEIIGGILRKNANL